jgi:hypothetical protein
MAGSGGGGRGGDAAGAGGAVGTFADHDAPVYSRLWDKEWELQVGPHCCAFRGYMSE